MTSMEAMPVYEAQPVELKAIPTQSQVDMMPQAHELSQGELVDQRIINYGLTPGGEFRQEKYCGFKSGILAFVAAFPCIYFCPIDTREVYEEPETGRKVILNRY